jgi:hypothetical protein
VSEPLNMTDGEKMVWAAAFVTERRAAIAQYPLHANHLASMQACQSADAAVIALRFGGDGPGRAEMCELGNTTARPTFNHSRSDGPFDPCPICLELMDRKSLLQLIKDRTQ